MSRRSHAHCQRHDGTSDFGSSSRYVAIHQRQKCAFDCDLFAVVVGQHDSSQRAAGSQCPGPCTRRRSKMAVGPSLRPRGRLPVGGAAAATARDPHRCATTSAVATRVAQADRNADDPARATTGPDALRSGLAGEPRLRPDDHVGKEGQRHATWPQDGPSFSRPTPQPGIGRSRDCEPARSAANEHVVGSSVHLEFAMSGGPASGCFIAAKCPRRTADAGQRSRD